MTPSGPPIHDREQAIKIVASLPRLGLTSSEAERIVDALGIGQPDPEVRLDDQETAEVRYWRERELRERERAERAEERLRAVEGALQRIAKAGHGKTWASQVAEEALRAVLPVEQEH